MNRIEMGIEKMKHNIENRLKNNLVTKVDLDKLHVTLDMDFEEYVKFQEVKSLAYAEGKLTLDEANTIYNLLGTRLCTYNSQPIAVKAVLNSVFMELMKSQMGQPQRV